MKRMCLSLVTLVVVFALGVVVGHRQVVREHDARVQALRAELQSWKAHHLGMPVGSLMTTAEAIAAGKRTGR